MINITFPDGATRQYEKGTTPLDIAKSISEGLAKKVIAASINGTVWDATRPINEDISLKLLTWNDAEGKNTFWHSSAHLMAEAVESLFPGVKFWVGPPVENGFYYDMDLGDRKMTEEDLAKLEKKMNELAKQNNSYIRKEISKKDAVKYFSDKGDEYKLDLLQGLNDGEITFYTQGNFTDLCRGPHIPNTGFIKAIKLTNIAGAYWKGDEKNKMLTRVYGVTFPTQKELDEYLNMVEEAKRRDHRKLGKELGIFTFDDDVGPGLPLWLPNGALIIEELERLAKETEEQNGYKRVVTPHIAKESLYLTSGHLPYYQDSRAAMDYARFNYVAQPGDNISRKGLFPRIGDYDKWAIEWGYRLFPQFKNADEEKAYLNKWVIEKLKNQRLWFGRQGSPDDPRSQNEDLGDDAMSGISMSVSTTLKVWPERSAVNPSCALTATRTR